jgi:hypothetical protein
MMKKPRKTKKEENVLLLIAVEVKLLLAIQEDQLDHPLANDLLFLLFPRESLVQDHLLGLRLE